MPNIIVLFRACIQQLKCIVYCNFPLVRVCSIRTKGVTLHTTKCIVRIVLPNIHSYAVVRKMLPPGLCCNTFDCGGFVLLLILFSIYF